MSERELQRIEVLAQVLDGSLRSATAASLLGLSQRQVQRLLGQVRDEGAMAVRHKLRGRPSNNRISALKRDYILSLIRSDYPGKAFATKVERAEPSPSAIGKPLRMSCPD